MPLLLKHLLFFCMLENEYYKHKTYFVVEGQGHEWRRWFFCPLEGRPLVPAKGRGRPFVCVSLCTSQGIHSTSLFLLKFQFCHSSLGAWQPAGHSIGNAFVAHSLWWRSLSETSSALGQLVELLHYLGATLFLVSPKSRLPLDLILDCKDYE